MKFSQMPYERVDFNKVEEEFTQLMKEFKEAGNGEKQFAVHQKYYEQYHRFLQRHTEHLL